MSLIKVAKGNPATEMIELLLRHIDKEAVQFKRSTASSKQILTKANAVYNGIQKHIDDIKNKTEKAEQLEWSKFETYTKAIPPLERLLLDYTYDIGDRSSQLVGHSEYVSHSAGDIPKSVVSIERWANDWQVTVKIVESLKSSEFKELSAELKTSLEIGLAEAVKQDDIDMIKGVQSYAKGSQLKDESIFEAAEEDKLVTGLTTMIDKIATEMDTKYDQASAQLVVKIVLLVYFPFALTAETGVERKWAEHLKSKKVWEKMNSALEEVVGHLAGKPKANQELEENYEALKKVIFDVTKLPELFGPQLLEMMKLAGQVRRPFHGRSVVLVYMWFYLASSKDVEAERLPINRRSITANLKQSIEWLTSASTKLRGENAFNDANEVKELTTKFDGKSAELQTLYTRYKLDWTKLINVQLEKATKVDTEHYEETKKRLEEPAPTKTALTKPV